jgi:hypothetical protein
MNRDELNIMLSVAGYPKGEYVDEIPNRLRALADDMLAIEHNIPAKDGTRIIIAARIIKMLADTDRSGV